MNPIRIGLIGCGGIVAGHALALLARADAAIVGLADPSPAMVARLVARVPALAGLPVFPSHHELLASADLDAVLVASPHTLHAEHVRAALDRGLHVLCEKPLVTDPRDGEELIALAEARGRVLMVSYQRHCDPGYRYLKLLVAGGALGELRSVGVRIGQNWRQLTIGSWRQDPALSGGGMLMDSGSHLVDMLLWLIDRPVARVSAALDRAGTPVDITTTALIEFAGGLQASLQSLGELPASWLEEMLLVGSEGIARYGTDAQHPWVGGIVEHWRGGELVRPLGLAALPGPAAHWLDVIGGAAQSELPARLGLEVARLTDAIYRAAASGQVIELGAA